jgi:hypothetical protein
VGIFIAAGVGLCKLDVEKARAEWDKTDPDEYQAIFADVHDGIMNRWSSVKYIPRPASYLKTQSWRRRAGPALLKKPTKSEQREHDGVAAFQRIEMEKAARTGL